MGKHRSEEGSAKWEMPNIIMGIVVGVLGLLCLAYALIVHFTDWLPGSKVTNGWDLVLGALLGIIGAIWLCRAIIDLKNRRARKAGEAQPAQEVRPEGYEPLP